MGIVVPLCLRQNRGYRGHIKYRVHIGMYVYLYVCVCEYIGLRD